MSGQKLNVPVVNVLWQIVASKRFDPSAQETREVLNCPSILSICVPVYRGPMSS